MKTILRVNLFLLGLLFFHSCVSSKENTPYNQFRAEQSSFQSTDGKISYIDKGTGPVILLLHGVPSSSWLYRKMIDSLAQKGYRVIAPDMLGFGNSDSPKGYELYNQTNHAKRLLELMDNLNISTWTHVFHDAGGLWTWELIKLAPKRINKLVMLNTIVYPEGFNPPIKMRRGIITKSAMWMYRNGLTTNGLLKKLFKVTLNEPSKMTKDDIEGYKTPLREGKTKGMYYFFSQTCHNLPNYSDLISTIKIPTLVIWGATDEMLQWEPQQEKIKSSMNIKHTHIIDAKHFIQEEKPQLLNKFIIEFME